MLAKQATQRWRYHMCGADSYEYAGGIDGEKTRHLLTLPPSETAHFSNG